MYRNKLLKNDAFVDVLEKITRFYIDEPRQDARNNHKMSTHLWLKRRLILSIEILLLHILFFLSASRDAALEGPGKAI